MKKMIAMLLALTACGGKTEKSGEETTMEDVVIELEAVDPEEDQPAEPAEEPEAAPQMPAVEAETEETPVLTPEELPEKKPAEKPADSQSQSDASVDLNAFYLSLTETYGENFPANMNLCDSAEMLDGFYPGLSDLESKQLMIYQPMMGAVVCEIALMEVSDAADVETVREIFQARIDSQVEGGAWYPESIEGWKNNSRIVVNGNCVMMIAYSECEEIVSAFNALFG